MNLEEIARKVHDLVSENKKIIVIGGDCSIKHGILRGLNKLGKKIGIHLLWFSLLISQHNSGRLNKIINVSIIGKIFLNNVVDKIIAVNEQEHEQLIKEGIKKELLEKRNEIINNLKLLTKQSGIISKTLY